MVFFYLNVPNNAFFKYMWFMITLSALTSISHITVAALGGFLTLVIVRTIVEVTGKIKQFIEGGGHTTVESC